jgi:lysozyme
MALLNTVIDLSHHNSVSSFEDVKNDGIVGVIHKATQGTGFVDSRYDSRKARALAAGLLWGAFHFGVGGNIPGQVDHFLNVVSPGKADLLVLDFEPNTQGKTMTLAEAEQFVQLVKDRTGRFPGLYSGESFIRTKVGGNTATVLKNCFLWVAKFSANLPVVPAAWKTFTFWQYTDGNSGLQPHQVNGVGRCDRDKFNGTAENLPKLWIAK